MNKFKLGDEVYDLWQNKGVVTKVTKKHVYVRFSSFLNNELPPAWKYNHSGESDFLSPYDIERDCIRLITKLDKALE